MYLAMYKGNKRIIDILIKIWTFSKYSHCEIFTTIGKMKAIGFSSSARDNGVRFKMIRLKKKNWDIFKLSDSCDKEELIKFLQETRHCRYDYKGIFLSQILPFSRHSQNKYFCSEWCLKAIAKMSGIDDNAIKFHEYSPQKMFEKLKEMKLIKNMV